MRPRIFVPAMLLGLLLLLGGAFFALPLLTPVGMFALAISGQTEAKDVDPVLSRLDDSFNARDLDRYVGTFAWDDPRQRDQVRARLQLLFAGNTLVQRSRVQGQLHPVGPRSAVLVQRDYHCDRKVAAAKADYAVEASDAVWLVLGQRDGALVPTALYEASATADRDPSQPFRCPACNYQVGGVPGWLCAISPPARAETLEAATFALLGTDVSCDVAVEIDHQSPPAAAAATALVDAMQDLLPGTRADAVEPWLPPSLSAAPPAHLTAARVRLELPDGAQNLLHVISLGALRHTLVVRGQARAMAAHQQDIAALLASYSLLQTDGDLALLAAQPIAAHQGGVPHDGSYDNALYNVHISGPAGWTATAEATGAAFSVVWRCPQQQGRMTVTGYRPPPELSCWCTRFADLWLDDLCRRSGMKIDTMLDPCWACSKNGAAAGQMRCIDAAVDAPTPEHPERRLLQLCMRDNLLVVLDGYVLGDVDDELLRAAFKTLRME